MKNVLKTDVGGPFVRLYRGVPEPAKILIGIGLDLVFLFLAVFSIERYVLVTAEVLIDGVTVWGAVSISMNVDAFAMPLELVDPSPFLSFININWWLFFIVFLCYRGYKWSRAKTAATKGGLLWLLLAALAYSSLRHGGIAFLTPVFRAGLTVVVVLLFAWLLIREMKSRSEKKRSAGDFLRVSVVVGACFLIANIVVIAGSMPPAEERTVSFADEAVEKAILAQLSGYDKDFYNVYEKSGITNRMLMQLETLEITGCRDLTGLEHCVNLRALTIHSDVITDISPVAACRNLEYIEIIGETAPYTKTGTFRDLGPLSELYGLKVLKIMNQEVSDLAPLSGLRNLEILRLYSNRVEDIAPLAEMSKLRELHLVNNRVRDVTVLGAMKELQEVYLSGNKIENISAFSGLTKLHAVSLNRNKISDLSPLAVLRRNGGLVRDESKSYSRSRASSVSVEGNPLSDKSRDEIIPYLESEGVLVRMN